MRPTGSNKFRQARWGLCLALLAIVSGALAQDSFRGVNPSDAFGAPPNQTVCPRNKPFMCENGDCMTNPTKCQATQRCPRNKPLRCADDSCVSKPRDCDRRQRCPDTRPFMCPDGSCAKDRQACLVTWKQPQKRKDKRNRLPSLR